MFALHCASGGIMGLSSQFLARGIAAAALLLVVLPAHADELADANAKVLTDPGNADLNLDYALIAEGKGKYRLALAAYERVLLNHPDNTAAKKGLMRVRRIIQPPQTQVFLDFGSRWESNIEHRPDDEEDAFVGYARATVKDERAINGRRWRTVGTAYGEINSETDELNYGYLSGTVGPLIDFGSPMMTLYPALGGMVAMADDRFYYADLNVSATFEGYLEGAYQWVRFRAGYRQYDDELTSDDGYYLDATGRLARSDVLAENDSVSISPTLRWNDVDGTFTDALDRDFSPGKYLLGGVKLAYDKVVNDLIVVGASFTVMGRYFNDDETPDGDNREDWTYSPGASILFRDVFGPQTGLRFDYRYDYNDSNDSDHDYDNHAIGVAVTVRR